MSVLLSKYGRLLLPPLFALAAFLAAFFYFGYPGGYDAPTVAQVPAESITAPASILGELPLFPPTEKGVLLVDGLHGNDFTKQELSVLLARVAERGYQVEVAGEASRFGGFSSLDPGSRLAQLQEKLRLADSLAVLMPDSAFTKEEADLVEDFVTRKGGKLLLIGDIENGRDSVGRECQHAFSVGRENKDISAEKRNVRLDPATSNEVVLDDHRQKERDFHSDQLACQRFLLPGLRIENEPFALRWRVLKIRE